jgi:uncharacterized lipoprotein YddW (UPF0748 family)
MSVFMYHILFYSGFYFFRMVERVYNTIHSIKPSVRFSISPFGIYRPQVCLKNGTELIHQAWL